VRPQHWPGLWAPGNASVSLPGLAARGPGPFLMHYAGRHPGGHILIFASVLAAVCCAIGAQYGVKNLVDVLGAGPQRTGSCGPPGYCCSRLSPATICSGDWPAGLLPAVLWLSRAMYAVISSSI
jgi:hypothetical protein